MGLKIQHAKYGLALLRHGWELSAGAPRRVAALAGWGAGITVGLLVLMTVYGQIALKLGWASPLV